MNDIEIEKAIKFLAENMPIEGMSKPTLLHSLRVGLYLHSDNYSTDVCIAGFLHDLVEDTNVTYEDIKKNFGTRVATLVEANTKNKNIKDKEERVKDLFERCVVYEDASIVKAADIMDNIEYYKRIDNEENLQTMIVRGELLINLKPENYKDKIFEKLKKLLSV